MTTRTKASIWMIFLIVSAFILGGFVTYYFVPSELSSHQAPPPPWHPRAQIRQNGDGNRADGKWSDEDPKEIERRTKFVQRWKEKLDLNEEQVEQFHLIFTAGHEKFVAASEASRERYSLIRRETDEAIVKVLKPDQAIRYKEITTEHRLRKNRDNQKENNRGNSEK
ncbi:MAG: hypothetical protein KAH24_04780 [Holophagae bacterium]|nr:hypothetical protein [Holophagae bacterium]